MKLTPWIFGSVAVVMMVACDGNKRSDTGTVGGAQPESGSMQGSDAGVATDTTMSDRTPAGSDTTGMSTGTGASEKSGTTAKNQSQSGVTDKSGKSTLGPGVTKTTPDQGEPVTVKGDTVRSGGDSVSGSPQ